MNKRSVSAELSLTASQSVKESDYWLKKLSGELVKAGFPYDRQPGAGKPGSKTGKSFTIPPEILSRLLKIVSGSDTRLHMLLAASVVTLLNKYNNNTRDIIIGMPVYKQEREGKFINTVLTLRNQLTPGMSFKELLLQVRQNLTQAVEHQNYPIETLFYNLEVPSLFDTAVLLENIHEKSYLEKVDLNMIFSFKREGEEVSGTVEYNAGLYEEATIERIQKHFIKLLREALFNIDIPLYRLDILSDEDKRQLLVEFNDNDREYKQGKTIDQLFEEQVEKNPGNRAVVGIKQEPDEVGSLTYAQLNHRANRMAHLLRSKGVTPGSIVGLLLERTIDMAVAIMAVIKAGGAYLPITPDTPADRIVYLLEDAHAALLVTHGGIALSETISLNHHILDLDKLSPALEKEPETGPEPLSRPADPVYCIFTSGSTGLPKGVLIGHRNLHNLVIGLHERVYKKHEQALNFALISPYIFDASVKMIFAALLLGHTLHIVPEDTRVDGSLLLDYFENFKIEVCDGTPTHLKLLVESGIGNRKNLCLKQFLIGGESLNRVTLMEFFRGFSKNPPMVTNVYGPTECSVDATSLDISPGDIAQMKRISIGKPMPNHRIYILDTTTENRLQPVGVTGELCIAGHGVSEGYLNRPELTWEKFYNDKSFLGVQGAILQKSLLVAEGKKLYKTGDLARWLADGNVEFVGRVDQQVKIRGYRLEPGEIENRLLKHEKIKEAIVVARKDAGGDDYLCAYIVAGNLGAGRADIDTGELREYLTQSLPDYMIPPYFVQLRKIPLTTNGKVDRRALPEPEIGGEGGDYVPPQNPCQEKLTALWSDILRLEKEKIGIDTNFFEIGGHSLKATILIARVHQAFDVKISLVKIFENPTIRSLSEEISRSGKTEFIDLGEVEKKEYYSLSFNQRRLWHISRGKPKSSAYTMTGSIVLEHKVAEEEIRKVLNRLMKRHENFRTGFKIVGEDPVQFVLPEIAMAFITIDLSAFAEQQKQEKKDRLFKELSGTTFDLSRPPLFRSSLLKFAQDRFEFIFCMHHIVSDGWSMEIVIDEFQRLYRSAAAGEEPRLEAIRFRYKDFAEWQNKQLTQPVGKRNYHFWKSRLEKGVPIVTIPGDFPGGTDVKAGSAWQLLIDSELKEKAKKLADAGNTTMFTVLFSAYLLMIYRFANREEVVCSIINSGRDHMALHRITGFFVNSVLFHNRVAADEPFLEFLRRINGDVIEVFNHQNFPIEPVFGQLGLDYPTIPASFNLLNMQDRTASQELEHTEPRHLDYYPDVKCDVETYLFEHKNGIYMSWTYNRNLYKPGTLKNIIDEYLKILDYFTTHGDKSFRNYQQAHPAAAWPGSERPVDMGAKPVWENKPEVDMFKAATLKELEEFAPEAKVEKYSDIEAIEEKEYYELSYNQKRLWILHQLEPESPVFNMPSRFELRHKVDRKALKQTLRRVMERHGSLRTKFTEVNEEPVQFIVRQVEIPFKEIDISALDEKDKHDKKERIYADTAGSPFTLNRAPLFRTVLVKLTEEHYEFIYNLHHIITDGWSMEIIRNEFLLLYDGYRSGSEVEPEPPRLEYKSFCEWTNKRLKDPVVKKKFHEFWKSKLAGGIPILEMPVSSSGDKENLKGAGYMVMINEESSEKLKKIAAANNTTLFVVIFSLYIMMLHRFTMQKDIACSIISAGREHLSLHNIIGFFVNSILFRIDVHAGESFTDFLRRMRIDVIEAFQNQGYPLELVCRDLKIKYPDISVSFNMLNIQERAAEHLDPFEPYHIEEVRDVKFDLEPYVSEFRNGINMYWVYRRKLFKPAHIEHIIAEYIKLIDFFTDNSHKSYEEYRTRGKKQKLRRR